VTIKKLKSCNKLLGQKQYFMPTLALIWKKEKKLFTHLVTYCSRHLIRDQVYKKKFEWIKFQLFHGGILTSSFGSLLVIHLILTFTAFGFVRSSLIGVLWNWKSNNWWNNFCLNDFSYSLDLLQLIIIKILHAWVPLALAIASYIGISFSCCGIC